MGLGEINVNYGAGAIEAIHKMELLKSTLESSTSYSAPPESKGYTIHEIRDTYRALGELKQELIHLLDKTEVALSNAKTSFEEVDKTGSDIARAI
jgi:hypothetical protein